MTVHDERANAVERAAGPEARDEPLRKLWDRVVGRGTFLAERSAGDRRGGAGIPDRGFGRERRF
jgi:hypothetical protein